MELRFDTAANCFFNAVLRECAIWLFRPCDAFFQAAQTPQSTGQALALAGTFDIETIDPHTQQTQTLSIACHHHSNTGRHTLLMPARLVSDGQIHILDFEAASQWILELPELIRMGSETSNAELMARVKDSLVNTQHAIDSRANELDKLMMEPVSFIESEGSLFSGHSIHPCPKARDQFTTADAVAYAPEYGNSFTLCWYQVHKDYLFKNLEPHLEYTSLIRSMAENDTQLIQYLSSLPTDYFLLPCHPFQHRVWQTHSWLQQLERDQCIKYLGDSVLPWRATSSLRAIYNEHAPWMLKFSMSVKLTNSIRHLQPEEMRRGVELCRVLQHPSAQSLKENTPHFHILKEPAAAAIKGPDGEPLAETMVLWRDNPFIYSNQTSEEHSVEVLASLVQDDPRDGIPRIVKRLIAENKSDSSSVKAWFQRFLEVCIEPLLVTQSNLGLVFGAHQQNLLIELDGVEPKSVYFRDCQGTGFTQLAFKNFGDSLPDLGEVSQNLIHDEMAIKLFIYYLFVNSTFNMLSSLATLPNVEESELISIYKNWLLNLKENVTDPQCINVLLNAQTLSAKGNFLCSIQHINENTTEDPTAIYHPFPNPIFS